MALGMVETKGTAKRPSTRSRQRQQALTDDGAPTFKARSHIFVEGDAVDGVWEVVDGVVIVYKRLADGRRQITEIVRPGGWVGYACGNAHTCSAQALTRSRLRQHRASELDASPILRALLAHHLARRVEALQEHALLLGRKSALERVASFLLALPVLGSPFGKSCAKNERGIAYAIALKRRDIGDYLGLKVETVSRNLAELKRRMIIATGKRGQFLLLDHDALRSIAIPR